MTGLPSGCTDFRPSNAASFAMHRISDTPGQTASDAGGLSGPTNSRRGAPWGLASCVLSVVALQLSGHSTLAAQGLVYLSPEAYESIPLASAPLSKAPLPARVDLSRHLPSPGSQGLQASCVGWAVAYGLKTYQESVERGQAPTGSAQMFSPAFVYNLLVRGNCSSGTGISDALRVLASEEVAPLSMFPYDPYSCSRLPDRRASEVARNYRISSHARVNSWDLGEVKAYLANGLPIVVGMDVGDGFQAHRFGVFQGDRYPSYPHAMLVTGYDDGLQAFRLFNSWGRDWGESGSGWISYRAFRNQTREAYVAHDMSSPSTTVPPREREEEPRRNTGRISATLGSPTITHDQPVPTPMGVFAGVSVRVPGRIFSARGRSAQVVLRFFNSRGGAPLRAHPAEYTFRDATGAVATGTDQFILTSGDVDLASMDMSIPYGALNLRFTNYRMRYDLLVQATVYVDSWPVAESDATALSVRW